MPEARQNPMALLGEYGERVSETLSRTLTLEFPDPYFRELVADYPTRGGRMLRPSLCLAACAAFGGSIDRSIPTAVAIELMHNAFLVHDDIEDES
ncbi:MAG: polyprenyl synthetase family protein, partial [Myxococcota bacterium]|nr:polyprenyl synthetase family protein [Myxococcota bacterium]